MRQFASLAFFALLILVGGASHRSLAACDLDELLKDDPVWAALKEDNKKRREITPVLKVLLCETPESLDPTKAFRAARQRLARAIAALVPDSPLDNELLEDLSPFSAEGSFDISRLKESGKRLRKALEGLSVDSPKLELYLNLAGAIESFVFLAPYEDKYKSPADYEGLLDELQTALLDYVVAPRSPIERKALGRVVGLLEAFAAADQVAGTDKLLLAIRQLCKKPNLWMQVSEELINEFVDSAVQPIDEPQSVRECILGTSIYGTARVCAKPSIVLCPASDHAALTVKLDGTTTSNTVGYQKPVRIKSTGRSSFWAHKNLTIPSFVAQGARATACTNTTICSIEKVGRQCLSRLIERIAWKRAGQQKSQAEAIASQKLARRVEASFDQRLNPALEKARKFYNERFRSPLLRLGIFPTELKFSSTSDNVRVGATFAKQQQLGANNVPPEGTPSGSERNDLTVAVHDSFTWNVFDSDRVPAETLDRLVKEFLSNLADVDESTPPPEYDPHLFEVIVKALSKPEAERARFFEEELPQSGKLKFSNVLYEDGWVIIRWQMREGQ